jgi:ABC-type transporter Mla subunit MlaD
MTAEILFQFITKQEGVFFACGGIVLLAIVSAFIFSKRIQPIEKKLRDAIFEVRKSKNELGFVENYHEFDEWINKSTLLAISWSEFTETLIYPIEDEKPIRNTHPAEDYFNEESLLHPHVNVRFYSNWSNILSGLGILGTFIGLVAGIYLAFDKSGDIQPESIVQLMRGASLAFTTSIAGISCSLLFSWFEKHQLNKISKSIRLLNSALDTNLERITPEDLAVNTLKEMKIQSLELKMFNTELAFNIATALEEKMAGNIVPALEKMTTAIEGLRQDRSDTNFEMIQKVVSEFTETLQGAAGEEMKAMGSSIKDLTAMMIEQTESMSGTHEKMQEGARKSLSSIDLSVDKLNQTVEKIGIASEAMGETANTFVTISSELKTSFDLIETVSRRFENIVIGLEEAADSIEKTNNQNTQAIEVLKEGVEQLRASQESLVETWKDYQTRFENIDQSVEGFFQKLQDGIQAYAEQVHNFMGGMDKAMAGVTQDLGSVAGETKEVVEELAEHLEKFLQQLRNPSNP